MQHSPALSAPKRSIIEVIREAADYRRPSRQFTEYELKGIRLFVADFVARLRGESLDRTFLRRLTHEAFYLLRWRLNKGLSVDAALEELERDAADIENTKWYPHGYSNGQRRVTAPAKWRPMGSAFLINRRRKQKAGATIPA